ncbi:MAG TPA: hypothetical protein VFG90_05465 [Nitrososphaeraceae archaeon]|nr:hypothetical protein [Nitrososphaeraceae archaeon]
MTLDNEHDMTLFPDEDLLIQGIESWKGFADRFQNWSASIIGSTEPDLKFTCLQ